MFLMGLPEEVVYFMCGALERTRASPTCCSRALTCFSTESQGPAVCRLPGRNGSTPHVSAAEHEGHPGPAVVLRCRRRLHSQLAGRQCAGQGVVGLTPYLNSLGTQRAHRPDTTCTETQMEAKMCWCGGRVMVSLALVEGCA